MKKAILMFCMAMSLVATSAFAQMQEVRGVSTRRVIYEGIEEYKKYPYGDEVSNRRYGWELTNHNSFKISVDITLMYNFPRTPMVAKTQSIILKPGEKYVFKAEDLTCTAVDCDNCQIKYSVNDYSIEFKAYKLQ